MASVRRTTTPRRVPCSSASTPPPNRRTWPTATLEGVGQGLVDGIEAVEATGARAVEVTLVGGGSRSGYWAQMLADIANRPLLRPKGATSGRHSARPGLARMGIDGGALG